MNYKIGDLVRYSDGEFDSTYIWHVTGMDKDQIYHKAAFKRIGYRWEPCLNSVEASSYRIYQDNFFRVNEDGLPYVEQPIEPILEIDLFESIFG